MTVSTNRESDRFMLRLPDGMRDRIREEAEKAGRSMNAEVVARLEQSLDGAFLDLSGVGFVATVKRLEATTDALDRLFVTVRDSLVDAVMAERGIDRAAAVQFIFSDWARRREEKP